MTTGTKSTRPTVLRLMLKMIGNVVSEYSWLVIIGVLRESSWLVIIDVLRAAWASTEAFVEWYGFRRSSKSSQAKSSRIDSDLFSGVFDRSVSECISPRLKSSRAEVGWQTGAESSVILRCWLRDQTDGLINIIHEDLPNRRNSVLCQDMEIGKKHRATSPDSKR